MQRLKVLFFVLALSCVCALQALAQEGVKLTMKFQNEQLVEVLTKLEKSSGYKFLYDYQDVSKYKVNGAVNNAALTDIVQFVLHGTPLKHEVNGNFIAIVDPSQAQKSGSTTMKSIGGYVVDKETGEPLVGARVRVIGTDILTVTDLNGAFSFNHYLGKNKLQVTYIGMETVETPLKLFMNIAMSNDAEALGEAVVTGIFRKPKETYTGAVATIDKDKLQTYRGSNLLQTLKNIDASINVPVSNLSGSNPNVLPNLNIRGSASLPMSVEEFNQNVQQSINAPLIIMDGFEISLTKLMDYNDEQIESINILKDASATAIYGSRGANGVIVIVSKTPQTGRLRVTAKAGLSLELPDLSSYRLLDASQKLQLEKLVGLYTSRTNPMRQVRLDEYYNTRLKDVLDGTDTDWMSKPLRNGVGQRYNVQLDGGANEFKWGASLGYNNVQGAMIGSSRKTYTGDVTLMYSVRNLTFRNQMSIASNSAEESKYGRFQKYVDMQPYNAPYDVNGNLIKGFPDLEYSGTLIGNPLYDASLNTFNKSGYFDFIENFSVEWVINEQLRARAKLGYSTNRSTTHYFLPAEHSTFNSSYYNTEAGFLRKGRYTYGNGLTTYWSADATLSYSNTFAKKHNVYVGANYMVSQSKSESYAFGAEGFNNEDLSFLGNALQYVQGGAPTGSTSVTRLVGITANSTYTYDNRYYIDLSWRMDGSSLLGSDNRFSPFWSAGIGWNVHNEKWFKDSGVLNTLRVRASYGLMGSQNFSSQSAYTTYQYRAGSRYFNWTAAEMMGLGNPNLTWQKTKQFNLGIEFALFKNRLTGQLDLYTKTTSNLLSSMELPHATGYDSYMENIGAMRNSGFELSLNGYIIRDYDRKINWSIGGQLVYNKNEITELSEAIKEQSRKYMEQNVDVGSLFYVGRPMSAIYAVQSAGIDPSTGREVFLDKDGNVTRTFNALDKIYLGPAQPQYRGNINSMLMYKGFTLNVSFGYHWGGKLYNSTLRDRVEVSTNTIAAKNVDERVFLNRWAKPGDVTFFRNFDDNVTTHATSRYVMDDKVLELQSVSLQYRWNTAWLKRKTGVESIVFGINANSLFYWSSVRYERGTDYPFARNIQATATFNF